MDLVNLAQLVLFLLLLIYCIALRWRLAWVTRRLAGWKAITRDLTSKDINAITTVAREKRAITFSQADALTAWYMWLWLNGEWR